MEVCEARRTYSNPASLLLAGLIGAQSLERVLNLSPDVFVLLCLEQFLKRFNPAPVAEDAERGDSYSDAITVIGLIGSGGKSLFYSTAFELNASMILCYKHGAAFCI